MDEDDTCRICRSGPEEDAPLFHPCRCSGSIAKVHQDCLIEWLQHSKKKSCELCNTELRFHKVYSPSMPSKIPIHLYVRQFLLQSLRYVRFALRAMIVATAWLAILPLGNIYIWRLHFWIADVLVWGIAGGAPPASQTSLEPLKPTATSFSSNLASASNVSATATSLAHSNATIANFWFGNATISLFRGNATANLPLLPLERLALRLFYGINYRRVFDNLAHDTFEGQILTCAIVIIFVAIFLLREWCMQNVPQQVLNLERGRHENDRVGAPPALGAIEERPAREQQVYREPEQTQVGSDAEVAERQEQQQGDITAPAEGSSRETLSGILPEEAEQHGDSISAADGQVSPSDIRELRRAFLGRLDEGRLDARESVNSATAEKEPASQSPAGLEMGRDQGGTNETDSKGKERQGRADLFEEECILELDRSPSIGDTPEAGHVDANDVLASPDKGKGKANDEFDEANGGNGKAEASLTETMKESPSSASDADAFKALDDASSELSDPVQAGEETLEGNDLDHRDRAAGEGQIDQLQINDAAARNDNALDLRDWEDDLDNGERLEDDIEGMMEAIGMRGPLANLLTNITLMFVLCSFTLTVSVAMPYTIGRLAGIGHLLPNLFSSPVLAFTGLISKLVKAVSRSKGYALITPWLKRADMRPVQMFIAKWTSQRSTANVVQDSAASKTSRLIAHFFDYFVGSKGTLQTRDAVGLSVGTLRTRVVEDFEKVYDYVASAASRLEAKTQGTSTQDRAFCIAVGHGFWLLGLAVQNVYSDLYVRWNMRSLKTFVDQQIVILKVMSFILLELVAFPLCCGVMADLALFPLFEGASLTGRFNLACEHPFALGFVHWTVGTLYMFLLAQFVGHTRSIMRPGVLCFVRDPGDPNFQPIKDILERRTGEQLRKIGLSGAIYSFILAVTIGICSHLVAFTSSDLLPLRLPFHQTMSSSGIEFCITTAVLPSLVKAWVPTQGLHEATKAWWRFTAHQLRLSWFLLGERRVEEEGQAIASQPDGGRAAYFPRRDGSYGRVPSDDHAIMSTPLIIRTDVHGIAVGERAKDALQRQQEAIEKLDRKPAYQVVFIPPDFCLRIIALVCALWVTLCSLCLAALIAPLLIGRALFAYNAPPGFQRPHDGYAWLAGTFTCLSALTAASKMRKMYRRLKVSSNASRRLGKHINRFLQRVIIIAALLTICTATGLTVELYFNGLTCLFADHSELPDISLWHATTAGFMEQYAMLELLQGLLGRIRDADVAAAHPLLRPVLATACLRQGEWRRPRAWLFLRQSVLPALVVLVALAASPLALLAMWRKLGTLALHDRGAAIEVTMAFSVCISSLFFSVIARAFLQHVETWTDVIKDEHFLISTELRNYSSHREQSDQNGGASDGAAAVEGDERTQNEVDGINDRFNVDGPLPDVILNAAR